MNTVNNTQSSTIVDDRTATRTPTTKTTTTIQVAHKSSLVILVLPSIKVTQQAQVSHYCQINRQRSRLHVESAASTANSHGGTKVRLRQLLNKDRSSGTRVDACPASNGVRVAVASSKQEKLVLGVADNHII
jgi:hypothetical protein